MSIVWIETLVIPIQLYDFLEIQDGVTEVMETEGMHSAPNELSGIVRKVFRRQRPRAELPDELQDDDEGYVLISWGDLSPSLAYLHGPTRGPNDHKKRKSVAQNRRPIIKKSIPPLSWAIRNTNMTFEEITQKYERGGG